MPKGTVFQELDPTPVIRKPSKHNVVPYRGLHARSVQKAYRTLDAHRATRQSLGAADVLDEPAFMSAHRSELASLTRVSELKQELSSQWEGATQGYITLAQKHGVLLSLGSCPSSLDELAESLDYLASDGTELLRLAATLETNRTKATTLGALLPHVPSHEGSPLDIPGAIQCLKQQLTDTVTALERARRWQDTRRALQEQLQDCAKVAPATSLATIEADNVAALLEYSLVDSDWDTLRPLLFRLWSEQFSWSHSAASTIAEVLEQALGAAASDGDLDRHAEQLSHLERGTLQDLLGLPHPSLVRHVVLATFRESLARRDSVFLTAIWGFERAWTTRSNTVGDRLQRLFSALYQCFVRSRSAPLAMSFLARKAVVHDGTSSHEMDITRAQEANDIAMQLEDVRNAPGLFGRLRVWSMTHYFRPVVAAVREQRRADVVTLIDRLRERFRNGDLVNEAIHAIGTRNTRADHRDSLTRYLDDQISLVASWLSRTAPEHDSKEDGLLGHESLELQRLSTQLARVSAPTGNISAGSVSWLENEVGRLIARLRAGDTLIPSPVWLGEGALTPLPTQIRSWAAHTNRSCGWRDLLQDQLAEHLLGAQRTLLQAVEELRAGGQLEAAIDAAQTAQSDNKEVRSALAALQDLKEWRDTRTSDIGDDLCASRYTGARR